MLKRYLTVLLVLIPLFTVNVAAQVDEQTPASASELTDEQKYQQKALALLESLNRITGEVELPDGVASLNVPESFYFLNSKDATKVLVDVWGNPPGQQVLGMLMPADVTPYDAESWAVTISYEEDGYVSDEDADKINYDELLGQLQEDTRKASKQRVQQGYESISLVGWASKPYYDAAAHKLHWAKEIKFANSPDNTLNYNIRMLGRKGVLVLNFIAGMEQKSEIDSALPTVLAIADFNDGSKYGDFNPDLDEVAAYGIGALIAGKVIAKTGFLVVALVFLKKFGIFILLGLGVFIRKLFGRKKKAESGES
jgi:uncharacterized membrane-anchored protein